MKPLTEKETEERFNALFDEYMDCPQKEKVGRLIAFINMWWGTGWVWK